MSLFARFSTILGMPAAGRKRLAKEAPSLGAAVDRMMRALVRRAEQGDLEAIEQLRAIRGWSGVYLTDAINAAQRPQAGYSQGEIARALGVSRQAVQQLSGSTKVPGPRPGIVSTIEA